MLVVERDPSVEMVNSMPRLPGVVLSVTHVFPLDFVMLLPVHHLLFGNRLHNARLLLLLLKIHKFERVAIYLLLGAKVPQPKQ